MRGLILLEIASAISFSDAPSKILARVQVLQSSKVTTKCAVATGNGARNTCGSGRGIAVLCAEAKSTGGSTLRKVLHTKRSVMARLGSSRRCANYGFSGAEDPVGCEDHDVAL